MKKYDWNDIGKVAEEGFIAFPGNAESERYLLYRYSDVVSPPEGGYGPPVIQRNYRLEGMVEVLDSAPNGEFVTTTKTKEE